MANVAVRVEPNPLDGLVETRLAANVRQQLAIAEATHGRGGLRNSTREQGLHLGDESSLDLIAHPIVDRAIERVARHRQTDFKGFERRWALALLGRHRDASRLVDLQGPNNASKVASAPPGRRGIDGA